MEQSGESIPNVQLVNGKGIDVQLLIAGMELSTM
jgi:hypothetical protein